MVSRASTRKRLPSVKLADSVTGLEELPSCLKVETPPAKRLSQPISKKNLPTQAPPRTGCFSECRVSGCGATVSERPGSRPVRVCSTHRLALEVAVDGVPSRFCEQCSRLHPVDRFDGEKRGCRLRLERRNIRRKKQSAGQKLQKKRSSLQSSQSTASLAALVTPPAGVVLPSCQQQSSPHLHRPSSLTVRSVGDCVAAAPVSPCSNSSTSHAYNLVDGAPSKPFVEGGVNNPLPSRFLLPPWKVEQQEVEEPGHVNSSTAALFGDDCWAEALPVVDELDTFSATDFCTGSDRGTCSSEAFAPEPSPMYSYPACGVGHYRQHRHPLEVTEYSTTTRCWHTSSSSQRCHSQQYPAFPEDHQHQADATYYWHDDDKMPYADMVSYMQQASAMLMSQNCEPKFFLHQ